ncbi:MAG TPA: hypothetical protein VFE25_05210, partial [Opitutaceae bacterium]|nr:hypothetical protein [Opitutaceae bacterium]
MPARAPARETRTVALACALVVAASVAAAYIGGIHGAFVYDDLDSVVSNSSIRDFSTALSPPAGATVSGRPILNLTLAVNYALGGNSPVGYHVLNIVVHVAAALVLLGIVRRTLATPAAGARPALEALLLASGASLLWALHPIQVESVGYVIQRAESLMGLFYLTTLYCVIRHSQGGRSSTAWASGAFVSCLLGMGTKESMATAPLVVFLFDRTFLAGSFAEAWRRRWKLYLLLAACWAPLALQVSLGGGRSGTAGFESGVPVWSYFITQMKAVVLYLRLSLWPRHLVGD